MGKIVKKATSKPKTSKTTDKDFELELKKVGTRIKQLRIKAGYTSYEVFAYESNISRSQVGRYENGEDLRMSSLFKILAALNVTPKEFFSEGF